MSGIVSITAEQQNVLRVRQTLFDEKARITGCSAAAAAFLLIGALIVIACGCLCLMLPGVNVVNQVILRAVVPGLGGISLSIPFIVVALKNRHEMISARKEMIHLIVSLLDQYDVPSEEKKERAEFILKNFLNWQENDSGDITSEGNTWTVEYQGKVLSDIKDLVGKEKKHRNPRQEKIATATDAARIEISKAQKK